LAVETRDLERGYSARPRRAPLNGGRAGSRRAARILGEVRGVKGRGAEGGVLAGPPLGRRVSRAAWIAAGRPKKLAGQPSRRMAATNYRATAENKKGIRRT
jgi:hypothetical protein